MQLLDDEVRPDSVDYDCGYLYGRRDAFHEISRLIEEQYEAQQEYNRQARRAQYRKAKTVARTQAWKIANPEKVEAHRLFRNAINRGEIRRSKVCERCGREPKRIVGHHTDYSKPLEVEWLCSACHREVHVRLVQIAEIAEA